MNKLDKINIDILRLLQHNARLTDREIGERLNLERSAVSKRIKKLGEEEYILKYQAVLNRKKLDLNYIVSTLVMLDSHCLKSIEAFEHVIEKHPNILQWSQLQGSWDYLLVFVTRDQDHYEEIYRQLIALDNVKRTRGYAPVSTSLPAPLPLPLISDHPEL